MQRKGKWIRTADNIIGELIKTRSELFHTPTRTYLLPDPIIIGRTVPLTSLQPQCQNIHYILGIGVSQYLQGFMDY